jgi:hypothetical protein
MFARRLGLRVHHSCVALATLAACGGRPPPARPADPCFTIRGDAELRSKDANKTLEDLAEHIQLSAEDEALRHPRSFADVRTILRRDVVYFFANAAAYARSLDTLEGRFSEAQLELLLGESQLVASQVLSTQEAWVGADLRVARANLAGEGPSPTTDRGRMLARLIRAVEEGNKIADALGVVAPSHLARGAEVIRRLRVEAPNDVRTSMLVAEYHRLRGEWTEFDGAMKAAESADRASPAIPYLRGMEQLERHRRPDLGAAIMRECLARYPRFVRAQAALVLMATTPAESLRELHRLKQMNQDHYLVMLLEPTLAAEKELFRMQGGGPRDAAR